MLDELTCELHSGEQLQQLAAAPLPLGLAAAPTIWSRHRDVYYDTADDTLRQRSASCVFRFGPGEERAISLTMRDLDREGRPVVRRWEAIVHEEDARAVLAGQTEPARRLRAFVDPRFLEPRLQVEVERCTRTVRSGWRRRISLEFHYDTLRVRAAGATQTFHELTVRRLRPVAPSLERIARALAADHGVAVSTADRRERAQLVLKWSTGDAAVAGEDEGERIVALVASRRGRVVCRRGADAHRLPMERGSGEGVARLLLRRIAGAAAEEVSLAGTVTAAAGSVLEVWVATDVPAELPADRAEMWQWMPLESALAGGDASAPGDGDTLAALAVALRTGAIDAAGRRSADRPAVARRDAASGAAAMDSDATLPDEDTSERAPGAVDLLNAELSVLEFNARVLALAEDPSTPLLERLRYIAIVGGNLDEFFAVRVADLRRELAENPAGRSADGLTPREQLEAIGWRVPALAARQHQLLRACLRDLEPYGIRLRRWAELGAEEHAWLRDRYRDEILGALTPLAITLSPGHPIPRVSHLTLALALVVRDEASGRAHFAEVELPGGTSRFLPLPDGGDFVPLEDVIRANLDVLYPEGTVESAHCFRLTRAADLDLVDSGVRDLLPAVEEAAHRRAINPIVRIEVERGMPPLLRELLLAELGNERGSDGAPLTAADVYEVDWPLDLRALGAIADQPRPELRYAPHPTRSPLDPDHSIFDSLREGDVIAHHPLDAFEATAGRLVAEAAEDPTVVAIKVTLYRVDNPSPVVEALLRAAQAGKEVVAYVELRARFEESRNVAWVRRLERAGARLVYGKVGLKTHAKVMLVVRREEGRMRRYVHAGSGNYNAATARLYTDVSLLSADPTLGADISDFFNELTGTPGAPQAAPRSCLVGPRHLLSPLLARIRREAEHARASRGGRIRIKINGLSDPEVVRALYEASRAGVEIDFVVRGICTLRPGVPGLSDRIRVVSILGRFLEHSRIYHFANGGADEYFIGSADLRPRNLRRRIELLVPVLDARRRADLDALLALYLTDPGAWELRPHGAYERRVGGDGVVGTQERLLAGLDATVREAALVDEAVAPPPSVT